MRRRSLMRVLALALVSGTMGSAVRAQPAGAITVTTAQDLVGTAIESADGRQAGTIAGVILDMPGGTVLFVVAGSGGDLKIGDKLLAVPYAALRIDPARVRKTIAVNKTLAQLQTEPPLDASRLADLGTPQWVSLIYQTYGVSVPLGGGPADRLTVIGDPERALAMNIRGLPVIGADGTTVGVIDALVLDIAAGRIAYVELTAPGFLNIRAKWIAVPPEALVWSGSKDAFVLSGPVSAATPDASLHAKSYPAQVPRATLEALYQRFNVAPFWEQTAATATK